MQISPAAQRRHKLARDVSPGQASEERESPAGTTQYLHRHRRSFGQTKSNIPARIRLRLSKNMQTILPSLCGILRSWTVLPSGL